MGERAAHSQVRVYAEGALLSASRLSCTWLPAAKACLVRKKQKVLMLESAVRAEESTSIGAPMSGPRYVLPQQCTATRQCQSIQGQRASRDPDGWTAQTKPGVP